MKIKITSIFSAALLFLFTGCAQGRQKHAPKELINDTTPSIHRFSIESLSGETIDFSQYKGKYILVVNTASKCGFTPQYKDLEEIYKTYRDKLVVVGFPSDNFAGQEFGSNAEIASFCEKNYGVTFPLTTKVDVKGNNTTPVYQFLTQKSQNGVLDAEIKWNFNKFLLDKEGRLLAYFPSKVKPNDPEVIKYIQ